MVRYKPVNLNLTEKFMAPGFEGQKCANPSLVTKWRAQNRENTYTLFINFTNMKQRDKDRQKTSFFFRETNINASPSTSSGLP